MPKIGEQQGQIKTILLIHTCSIKEKFIFQRLKKLGHKIICLNKEKNWAQNYVDEWIIADTNDFADCIREIKSFLVEHPEIKIDGALTFWEESTLLVSKITDHFRLTGIPYAISKKVRNKFLFREFCEKNNLPTPKYAIIRKEEDLASLGSKLSFPLVMKPIYGSASAFVIKIESEAEALETYRYIQNNITSHPDSAEWLNFEILVEEYIDGHEVDIDIILQNGKIKFHSITDNYQTNEPFFIETGGAIPSSLPEKEQAILIELAEETLEKLEIQNGIIHFEAKVNGNVAVPIEINLRMGGDDVFIFVKGVWEVDLIENAVKVATKVYIPKIHKAEPKKYIIDKFFLSNHSGILTNFEIKSALKHDKNLEGVHFFKKIGDPILVPPEGYEYLGWLNVSGNNALKAKENLNRLEKMVNYEIAKFDQHSSLGKTIRKRSLSFAAINTNLLLRKTKLQKIKKLSLENQRSLHIGIVGNDYQDLEEDLSLGLTSGRDVEKTLKERGYKVNFFDFNNFSKAFRDLQKNEVDLVFNVCERINNSTLLEPHAAALLDVLQIPYTGSSPHTLSLCVDKIRVKKLLSYHGIPTPKWDYAYAPEDEIRADLQYPLIVKPSNRDNSFGINNDSVVTNKKQLEKQLERIIRELHCQALVEEYIEGDEYEIAIMGNEDDDLRVLPLTRSIFSNLPENYWHIYPLAAKLKKKPYDRIILQSPPKNISKSLGKLITEIALDTYSILDCQDYGHVEIRMDRNNNPYVLELNPNPSINQEDILPRVARITGLDYGDFLEEVIGLCINRYKHQNSFKLTA
ncbi:ATP-grasp domain-containing protein [Candidatus Gracilibacteria bacterium]|nr:ATP-grasp domain-containing protein [Candidatus Gracilibacteria bacterium]MCF7856729.1 ATP-grasp domain-containing protein [Candidatus Gracilibacteria bacterium]MCF7897035.1 ATP-grasp domain-containing protein [Candidatus Gracilibacteria bacterium]